MKRIAIVGGGLAGLSAAYELQRNGHSFTLFEQSDRLGGIVDTLRQDGFVIERGPDGWVTEKPWARELAIELGLEDELITSNDHERITWVLQQGNLLPMPDNMRMMVPENVDTILQSPLFSEGARSAYIAEERRADELKAAAPAQDESVASFIQRHFGEEVLRVIGAPLLGGVFGGDVHQLSVRAVMPAFVQMEREYGSLIRGLASKRAQRGDRPASPVFTSLKTGTGTLVERMAETLPDAFIRLNAGVKKVERTTAGWLIDGEAFDHLMLALPVHHASRLLAATDERMAELIVQPTSSAVIVGFGYLPENAPATPKGFGFLSPEGEDCTLLAATFSDQKYTHRVPEGGKSLRAFFGGREAEALQQESDEAIIAAATREMEKVLGPLPQPAIAFARRLPSSLPQYGVGHGERMAELQQRVNELGSLHLLGNGYRGVGLPDLIRDGRAAARELLAS
ncbi:protoporphyrinogen oxidase [Terriglobus sp. TAA 43]|uniref:protoporphyrinogen oxidase n=1 Tax=Terriglobus sp. TAA 43 TaxID=278961 RepID=UPI000645C3E8|nr:protoporphyrinogen oxidase [Terriglobus sp. TAA 43]